MRLSFRPTERFTVALLCLACLTALWFAGAPSAGTAWAYNSDNLIRLHVIANSDSATDQATKLAVRDAVNAYLAPSLSGVTSVAAASDIVRAKLGEVEQVADAALAAAGITYTATAEYGRYAFPTRTYADLVVPAGDYDAVRVVLGDGAGRNWWCVIFPPLCFVDIATKQTPAAGATPALSSEEIKLLTAQDPDTLPPVLRSKFVELIRRAPAKFRSLANWLAGAVGRR